MPKTILLAEDDENDAILVQRAFEEAGMDALIQVVRNCREAIRYLAGEAPYADRKKFPWPALMLLDMRMPPEGGKIVLEWLARAPELKARLPVVVLTVLEEEKDITLAYRLGANSYLSKPFDFTKLVEMAGALGHYWLNLNRLPKQGEDV